MTVHTPEELLGSQLEQQKIYMDEPVIEDADGEDDDEDEDHKDEDDAEGDDDDGSKLTRSEKKTQKAMLKIGMKPVPGVSQITVKVPNVGTTIYLKPVVFKSPSSDTFIVIGGNPRGVDLSSQLQTQAAEQFKAPDPSNLIARALAEALAEDDEDVDETDIDSKDIDLVMTQAGVSRSKAVNALKTADGDIVTAIMDLTN